MENDSNWFWLFNAGSFYVRIFFLFFFLNCVWVWVREYVAPPSIVILIDLNECLWFLHIHFYVHTTSTIIRFYKTKNNDLLLLLLGFFLYFDIELLIIHRLDFICVFFSVSDPFAVKIFSFIQSEEDKETIDKHVLYTIWHAIWSYLFDRWEIVLSAKPTTCEFEKRLMESHMANDKRSFLFNFDSSNKFRIDKWHYCLAGYKT